MKFIIDAQLPKSLSDFLNRKDFDSIHTLELPNKNKTKDHQIIEQAIEEERIVISKDNDFLDSFLIKSEPPKLIMVKTDNIPNKELIQIFDKNLDTIIEMITKSNLVEISKNDIAEHD
ncbi:MAG: DUF5615 family PIN-like protein [Bacteroidales bacterium]|nr:DUF5615 family PIN-like protein [Bacteroidales bacterium]